MQRPSPMTQAMWRYQEFEQGLNRGPSQASCAHWEIPELRPLFKFACTRPVWSLRAL